MPAIVLPHPASSTYVMANHHFTALPKTSVPLGAALAMGDFAVEQRSRSRIRFSVTMPDALTMLFVENTRADWRLLSPAIRFTPDISGEPTLSHRFHEISRFPNQLTTAELAALEPERIRDAFLADYRTATTTFPVTVRVGAPADLEQLLRHVATLHGKRVWIVARSPMSQDMEAGAIAQGTGWSHAANGHPTCRLLSAIAAHYQPFGQVARTTTHGTARQRAVHLSADPIKSPTAHDQLETHARLSKFIEQLSADIRSACQVSSSILSEITTS